MKKLSTLIVCFCCFHFLYGAEKNRKNLGQLDEDRSSYDVKHYDITLKIIPEKKRIEGHNTISIKMLKNTSLLRLDFAAHMQVDTVSFTSGVSYQRKGDLLILFFQEMLIKDSVYSLRIGFNGIPKVAELPPWKGGFVWSKDLNNNDWIGLACESLGASAWLPCKDHWSDEPEGMDMHLIVPEHLTGVSNGRLVSVKTSTDNSKEFHWRVINPINLYNISINVGKYTEIKDVFEGDTQLDLTYYVLDYNKGSAEKHFLQVHGMLKAFEHYFGPYPFAEDGYKLVETPYWGMEHQSCIAYGNQYKNNTYGFDFIIIHESGHEWFANSITASDPSDLWIHESFTTYSEALYLEYNRNRTVAIEYLLEQKQKIASKSIMQGPRNLYFHGWKDSDIYYKGTWMLHTMRTVLHNDSLWFASLKAMNRKFYHRLVSTEEVIKFMNDYTGYNWNTFYRQYLYSKIVPVLKIRQRPLGDGRTEYSLQLKKAIKGFELPLVLEDSRTNTVVLSDKEARVILDAGFDLFEYIRKYYLLELDLKSKP